MSVEPLALRVHVPVACFRNPYARDYVETFPTPPPSTVYGMLLSLVGEEQRGRHIGAKLVIARIARVKPGQRHPTSEPASRVLRTFFRWKNAKDMTDGKNRAPDYQELLTNVRVAIWLSDGEEVGRPTLRERVTAALAAPNTVSRYGALCLGESTHMVDGVWKLDERPLGQGDVLEVVAPDPRGTLSLPVWADHVGSKGTRWAHYDLRPVEAPEWRPDAEDWTLIRPPG